MPLHRFGLRLLIAASVLWCSRVPSLSAQAVAMSTRQLAPGVHAVITDPRGLISDSNVLIIINDADVVVVDANILPQSFAVQLRWRRLAYFVGDTLGRPRPLSIHLRAK